MVAEYVEMRPDGFSWKVPFRRVLTGREIAAVDLIGKAKLNPYIADTRSWRWNRSAVFTVKPFRNLLSDGRVMDWNHKLLWQPGCPTKCQVCSWLLAAGRLPTHDHIRKFLPQICNECYFCGVGKETIEHLFIKCGIT